jgi:hypothetical protein
MLLVMLLWHSSNFGNVCYHSAQNHLSSYQLSKNINIKIYNLQFYLILHGRKTWSLTLREE